MDNFIVSARKYRPATFETVVGQQHITGTLKNAIKNSQLAQAFLFCGPRGVGKTTCARILAKTINCQQLTADYEACGQCNSCTAFQNGASFSIHELDAASNNSVDDIRSLIEQVRIPPQTGKYKIYIIDEVHMLSQQAFNAFLKTLEEPPTYAIFILATTEKHKILPTILSRCQIFDFNRIRIEDMTDHLVGIAEKEGIVYERDGLHIIAQKADGGLRDALSMFDQIVSFSNKQVTYQAVIDNLNILDYDYYFKITDAILAEDAASTLLVFNEILSNGFDGSHFIGGLASHFRNLLVVKEPSTLSLLEVSESIRQRYAQQGQALSAGMLLSALNIANQCEINYRSSKNQRLQVELALLKMSHISAAIRLAENENIAQFASELQKKKSDPNEAVASPLRKEPTPLHTTAVAATTVPPPAPTQQTVVETLKTVPAPTNTPTAPTEEPKPKLSSWGNIALENSIPNLNTILDEKEEEATLDEPKLVYGVKQESFSMAELELHWNHFADQLKAENKITLYTLMTANKPTILEDDRLEIVVENPIQSNLLDESKIDIVNYLRVKLNNYAIELVSRLEENSVVRKPYTAKEKYLSMVAKNPALEDLQKTFDLGLE